MQTPATETMRMPSVSAENLHLCYVLIVLFSIVDRSIVSANMLFDLGDSLATGIPSQEIQCAEVLPDARAPCLRDSLEQNRTACVNRGCCIADDGTCFHNPSHGPLATRIARDPTPALGITCTLTQQDSSMSAFEHGVIPSLSATLRVESERRIHLRISDPKNASGRYNKIDMAHVMDPQPPSWFGQMHINSTRAPLVSYTTSPFGFSVARKDADGKVAKTILNTTSVGGLVFAEQYISM